jgi:hypothetical protein
MKVSSLYMSLTSVMRFLFFLRLFLDFLLVSLFSETSALSSISCLAKYNSVRLCLACGGGTPPLEGEAAGGDDLVFPSSTPVSSSTKNELVEQFE